MLSWVEIVNDLAARIFLKPIVRSVSNTFKFSPPIQKSHVWLHTSHNLVVECFVPSFIKI